jgi:hypothetical protein
VCAKEIIMQTRLWPQVYRLVQQIAQQRPRGSRRIPDAVIVLTLLWAAAMHKPVSWACVRGNWPAWMCRHVAVTPTPSTMSRRLRTASVGDFLVQLFAHAQACLPQSLCLILDGKPLVIGGGSKDRQAGYGRAVGGKAKGYKLHTLLDLCGRVLDWRVAPMNISEQRMAARLLRDGGPGAYVLGDANYDSNRLHAVAASAGLQLVTPRRYAERGVGRRRQRGARLRSIELVEGPSGFGASLLKERDAIERYFGNLTSFDAGLGPLPSWVRTHRRVRLWVHAKLILNAVRMHLRTRDAA